MLKLGGIVGLKIKLKQFASVELGELGPTTTMHGFSLIKSYLCLSTFFVA
jgi:hypothetical protein